MTSKATLVFAGAVGAIVLIAAIGLIVIYSGAYNIAATSGHGGLTRWALHGAMENGVARRAPDAPEAPATPAAIAAGAGEYKAMCQTCHGGPGVDRAIWAGDMEPTPPDLADEAEEWDRGEIYWIVSNGVKMTGMPAFGPTHDEATVWNIAGFVEALPGMTPEEYAAFAIEEAGHGAAETAHGAEGHTH